jgi:DNA-binding CsgD family transcriptional regulator
VRGVASGVSAGQRAGSGDATTPDVKLLGALLSSLSLAEEHGGAEIALEASGVEMDDAGRLTVVAERVKSLLSAEVVTDPVREALALGFLAGRVAHRPRSRRPRDPTSFLMDSDLLVQAAEGESVMRLPWFEEGLFVGRQLPDITEMPSQVRETATENYRVALTGERRCFAFTSYGHSYNVEAVPMLDEHETAIGVLAVATPALCCEPSADAFEQTAVRFERSALGAEKLAERHTTAGRHSDALAASRAAVKARSGADRMREKARQMRDRSGQVPTLTEREIDVLQLASHGLTVDQIAEHLCVSAATVKTHHHNIYARLGVSDKAEAVAWALRHAIID